MTVGRLKEASLPSVPGELGSYLIQLLDLIADFLLGFGFGIATLRSGVLSYHLP